MKNNSLSWTVYIHTTPNNKRYIGITGQNPNKRWKNGRGYERQNYFYSAIKKYGWNNITHEIVFSELTKKSAERIEQILIVLFKSNNHKYGYNISIGGENGAIGCKKTKEQKEYLRSINLGKKLSEEHKRKISQSHLGVVSNLSLEERQRRSQNFIINNPNNRKVYCLETDKTYISGSIAAKDIGLSCDSKNVTRCCRHEIKSVQGYHFCFVEELKNMD